MNWTLLPAMQRAWTMLTAGPRDETTTSAQRRAGEEPSIVAALCTCVLLDRRAKLRSLFQLEAGQGRLSRPRASAFIDAFLTLAAHAYLRDALELGSPGTAVR